MIVKIFHILIVAEILIECEFHHDYYYGKKWRNPYYRPIKTSSSSEEYEDDKPDNFYLRNNRWNSSRIYPDSNSNYRKLSWWWWRRRWWIDESRIEKIQTETPTSTTKKSYSLSLIKTVDEKNNDNTSTEISIFSNLSLPRSTTLSSIPIIKTTKLIGNEINESKVQNSDTINNHNTIENYFPFYINMYLRGKYRCPGFILSHKHILIGFFLQCRLVPYERCNVSCR